MKKIYAINNLIGAFLLVNFLLLNSLNAQVIKAFAQRTSVYTPTKKIYSIQGDYTMIGNTNLTLQNYGDFTNNSSTIMEYVDVDSDTNTFNSSSATLQYSTENGAIPQCSRVLYAGLYWTGRASNEMSSPEEFSVTKNGVTKTLHKRKVYLKGPGQTNYSEFVANPGNIYYPNGIQGNMYSSYVEITDYIQDNGLGEYTLADIALMEGDGGPTGYYGGWGMIVVYENSLMNWRDVTIFDGHAYVQGNATLNYELPVSGFQTIQSGQVNMKVGVMAGEGDVGLSGDYFRIRNWQDDQWITLNHSGNSTNNFFNSSIVTGGNPRNPNLQNNTGLDIASFNIPNAANTVITNNQTSTRFQYGSTQDAYIIFCIAMAVNAYVPDVQSIVSTEYINGVPAGSGSLSATPGQLIDYKLEVRNKGSEAIDDMVITIPIPYNSSFTPSSIGTQVNFSPLPTPNNAYFDPLLGPTGSIVWDFGDLPMPPVSNQDSILAELNFQLEVTTDCYILTNPDCPPQIVLTGGNSVGVGAVSGANYDLPFIQGFEDAGICTGEPITTPLKVDIDFATYVLNNCGGIPTNRDYVFCNYGQATLPVDSISQFFPSGLRFYNENNVTTTSIEYDENNPFPNLPGTNTYFAIPNGGHFCYYTFTITIQDSIATNAVLTSQVSCPGFSNGSIDLSVNGGTNPISYVWTGPSGFTASSQDINNLADGTYSVQLTDGLGCVAFDTAIVTTIPDLLPPVIFCPSNISINTNAGTCTYSQSGTTWDAQLSENCSIASFSYSLSGATSGSGSSLNGIVFNSGTTNVMWEAADDAGNISSCNYSIIVNDNEDPIILDCGVTGSQTVVADAGACSYTNTGTGWDVVATDNCTTITVGYALTGATTGTGTTLDGATFNTGTTTVTWTVTDASGNTSTCSYNIIVEDTQPPIILNCGVTGSQTVGANAGACTYTNAGTGWDIVVTDNCTSITVAYALTGVTTGTGTTLDGVTFNIGTTTVTWTVTDNAGNTSTCNYDIVVEDSQDPIILDCGVTGLQTVGADAGVCTYTNTGTGWDVVAIDNCTTINVDYVSTGATTGTGTSLDGVTFNNGTTTVTWTITDNVGNTSTCSFDIIVEDNQLPVIAGCPSDVTTTNAPGICGAVVNWTTPIATDNCGINDFISTHNSGDVFPVGVTTVNYTAIDDAGNITTCLFDITITDIEGPVINNCPSDINISNDAGICGAPVTWTVPTATDNCGVSFTSTHNSGDVFPVGTTTVIYTAIDGAGNSTTCSFDITITDNEGPVVNNCPSDITTTNDAGICGAAVTWTPPTFTDNCGSVSVTSTHNSGQTFPVGITTVRYTGTDVVGNVSQCVFDVTVNDTELPTISCGTDLETCDSIINYAAPTVNDNCGVASVTMIGGLASGSNFPMGTTTVTYEVEDIHGNTAQCSFDVTIVPLPETQITATDVSCNGLGDGSLDLTVTNGTSPYSFVWSNGNTDEDINGLSPGTYDVIVTDNNGCTAMDTATITEPDIIDISSIVQDLLCNGENDGEITLSVMGGVAPYNFNWSNGSTDQNQTGLTAGTYDVTVTDDNGCTVQSSIDVEEPDAIQVTYTSSPATCEAPDGEVAVEVIGGTTPYSYDWSNGSTGQNLEDVTSGQYELIITDANGCTYTLNVEVESDSNLDASILSTDVTCYGENNGVAAVLVHTGNGPYTYNWSNGANTSFVQDLVAETYEVVVTDNFDCQVILSVDITQPDPIEIDLFSPDLGGGYNVKPYGAENGSITSDVFGGTLPYNFNWSTGETTQNISGLTVGMYTLVVTDQNGCVGNAMITLTQPEKLRMPQAFSPNNDGDNDYFFIQGIDAFQNNEIKVFNRWGNVVYQMNNYNNTWSGENNNDDQLPDAMYFVVVTANTENGDIQFKGYVDLRRK